jgi:titin
MINGIAVKRSSLAIFSIVLAVSFSSAFAATAPDPPSNPSATAVSSTQINIFWNEPTNNGGSSLTGYKIEYKVGTGSYTVIVANTGTPSTTYYSHSSLTTNTAYTYKIYAINSIGTSNAATEISTTTTSTSSGSLPGTPTNLVGVAASPTQVNLSWTAPTNTGGYPISGYKIEYRVGAGAYSTLTANTGSTSTSYSHTGLTTGQVYVYRVSSVTSFGTGTQTSNEVVVQPTSSSALTAPNAPTGVSATAVSPTRINLSWVAPSNNGGSAITSYKIEVKSGSGSFANLVSSTGNTTTTYSHTGLTTDTTYTYRVSAINSIGTSSSSSETSATPTSSSTSGAPSAPTGLVATASSNAQINLSWAAPASDGGYPITGYKIEYKIGSGTFTTLVANTASSTASYSHTGLTNGTTYAYRVSAINSIGTSSTSAEASATPSSSSSAGVPGSVTSLVATPASPTQINLSWVAPSNNGGSTITGYKIEAKKSNSSYDVLVSNSQSSATSFSHTGLTTGTTYTYRISAVNSIGAGAQSEVSATPKETTAPTVTATAVSPTSITLTWIPPSQTYKQSITGYKIEQKISQDNYVVIDDNAGTSTSHTINGLTTEKTYTYVVSAHFTLGSSPRSADATATPLSTSNASPPSQSSGTANVNPPTNVIATPYSPTQINLSWNAPSSAATIVGYKIEVKRGPGQFETLTPSTLNSTTKYSHANIATNIAYTYRIYTITSSGTSLASSESTATATLSTTPPSTPVTANPPSPPTLSANRVSPTQINLYWTMPTNNGGTSVTGYKIEYKIGTDSYRTLTSKTTTTTYSHSGLLANTYSYRVYAINPAGLSVPSNEVSIKTAEIPQPESKPEPTECGTGTIFDEKTQTCVIASEPEPAPEPEPQAPTTHIPGFPDPTKDPQSYVERYNSEAAFKSWFDKNFPGRTIYEVVGIQEPEPAQLLCGEGTHLENGVCIPDKTSGQLGGGCLIATATYGTELSSQVQMLREIRDNVLFSTGSGTAFMTGFNEFYYSFSPAIADLERENPLFREAVKTTIIPMLSTLSILQLADIDSESEMLGYGIGVILLNAVMYLGVPTFLILTIRNKLKTKS